ncbi:hypothetical protein [Cryptosporangium sp. NPDC051539]|uniref:hypothetical protein n=1 Tax=Cryptosporangium sp. NPDC051539 TaxID=3363962 RepID=UPI0037A2C696
MRRLIAVALSTIALGSALLAASPAQAATVVAEGSLTQSNALGYTKISMTGATLTGFFTIKDTKTDGSCAYARVVYKNDSNTTLLTSQTGKSCTTGGTVQYSIPTTSNTSISKAVLEVWNGASGAKKTRTFGIG